MEKDTKKTFKLGKPSYDVIAVKCEWVKKDGGEVECFGCGDAIHLERDTLCLIVSGHEQTITDVSLCPTCAKIIEDE